MKAIGLWIEFNGSLLPHEVELHHVGLTVRRCGTKANRSKETGQERDIALDIAPFRKEAFSNEYLAAVEVGDIRFGLFEPFAQGIDYGAEVELIRCDRMFEVELPADTAQSNDCGVEFLRHDCSLQGPRFAG